MNGHYSKMRSTHKSRSVDLSDLLHFPSDTETPRREHGTEGTRDAIRIKSDAGRSADLSDQGLRDSSSGREKPETRGGESFGMVLSRSCSTASKRFRRRLEGQNIGAQCSAVKRAFSMRRSSSVSGRYCRIHVQSTTHIDYEEEEDDGLNMAGSMKNKKSRNKNRGGKIIKACKRFLGL
ncbi:hypothetical protein CDL15_Pgr003499 [Punica granatum]|nr:hypothetical protein CDL15_Pgr003499 [Punica granatum]